MAPSPRSVFECQRYRSPQQLRHSGLQITPLPGSKPWLAGSPHSPSHRFGYLGSSPNHVAPNAQQGTEEQLMSNLVHSSSSRGKAAWLGAAALAALIAGGAVESGFVPPAVPAYAQAPIPVPTTQQIPSFADVVEKVKPA